MKEKNIVTIVLLFSCSVISSASIIIDLVRGGNIIWSSMICSLFVLSWSLKRLPF